MDWILNIKELLWILLVHWGYAFNAIFARDNSMLEIYIEVIKSARKKESPILENTDPEFH